MGRLALVAALLVGGCVQRSRVAPREMSYSPPPATPLPPPLETYPNREALADVARLHQKPRDWILLVSYAGSTYSGPHGTSQWDYICVDRRGRSEHHRDIWSYAEQGGNLGDRPADPARVQAELNRLPPSVPPPPLNDVLIVSFEENGIWTTRIYDRYASPPALNRIYRLIQPRAVQEGYLPLWTYR